MFKFHKIGLRHLLCFAAAQYQNRSTFIEDLTKTFWCVFLLHHLEFHLSVQ